MRRREFMAQAAKAGALMALLSGTGNRDSRIEKPKTDSKISYPTHWLRSGEINFDCASGHVYRVPGPYYGYSERVMGEITLAQDEVITRIWMFSFPDVSVHIPIKAGHTIRLMWAQETHENSFAYNMNGCRVWPRKDYSAILCEPQWRHDYVETNVSCYARGVAASEYFANRYYGKTGQRFHREYVARQAAIGYPVC